ncbi:hypothetical protein BJV82DRAFT_586915 [Fennellomyces sp. T-0311]|nr:hypothetical protein BJV82DRAFT_586915 [Fennellomyces sp. T-0311]
MIKSHDSSSRNDPFHYLPLEAQVAILACLGKSDLLKCALVSRRWMTRVLDLGQIRWRCLKRQSLFANLLHLHAPYYAKQLEAVHLRGYSDTKMICQFLSALRDTGCTKIRQLIISGCCIDDPTTFIDTLKGCIAENLHAFAITSTDTALTPLSILTLCPQLRVLYYEVGRSGAAELSKKETMTLPRDVKFDQLVCLSLHGAFHESRFREIARRSRNLRFVRLFAAPSRDDIYKYSESPGTFELATIQGSCQNIEHIEFNRTQCTGKVSISTCSEYDELPWWKKYVEMDRTASPYSGLRVFKYIESEFANSRDDVVYTLGRILKYLKKHQDTLESLHLGNMPLVATGSTEDDCPSDPGDGYQPVIYDINDLSFPNLRDLAFIGDIDLEGKKLRQFLLKSSTLESLEISVVIKGLLDEKLPSTMVDLKSLKSLSFKMPGWYDIDKNYHYPQGVQNFTDEKNSIASVLTALGESSDCRIESLCLGGHICGDLASPNGIGLTDTLLDAVAKVRSVRKLQLHHQDLYQADSEFDDQEVNDDLSDMELTKTGLISFAKAIKNSKIQEMWLEGIEEIPTRICTSIGSMASLRELHVAGDLNIDGRKLSALFGRQDKPRYMGKLIIHDDIGDSKHRKTVAKYGDKLEFCYSECISRVDRRFMGIFRL